MPCGKLLCALQQEKGKASDRVQLSRTPNHGLAGPGVIWKKSRVATETANIQFGYGEVYVTKLFCKRVSAYQGILFSCMTRGVPNAETATRSSKAQRERRGRTPCWSCQSPRAPAWDLLQVGRDEPRDSTIHCWKTCLLLTAWYLKREVNALKSLIQWY